VHTALLYYYFQDKQALYRQGLAEIIKRLFTRLEQMSARVIGARERASHLVDTLMDLFEDQPEIARLIGTELFSGGKTFIPVLKKAMQASGPVPAPLKIILEGVENGEIRRVDPLHTWWCVIGMCMITFFARPVYKELKQWRPQLIGLSIERRREAIIDLLVSGLNPQQAGRRTR